MIFSRKVKAVSLVSLVGILILLSSLASQHTNINAPRMPSISIKSKYQRENATFIVLASNKDLDSLATTITSYEARFNHKYGYHWLFLNDDEFTQEFKDIIGNLVSGEAEFARIPHAMWSFPDWVSPEVAKAAFQKQEAKHASKSGMESYHHMCRFESGFFYRHPAMRKFKYYWRVEPETTLLCDIDFDVFRYIRENGIRYAFAIADWEQGSTVDGLWDMTLRWAQENSQYIHPRNLGRVVVDRGADGYNLCQFWSNFEIADADFLREPAYSSYFDFLDKSGGFFLERWGDAPVHTLAASLLLDRNEVAQLDFIGYEHRPNARTPLNFMERNLKCATREKKTGADLDEHNSCVKNFFFAQNLNSQWPQKFKKHEDGMGQSKIH